MVPLLLRGYWSLVQLFLLAWLEPGFSDFFFFLALPIDYTGQAQNQILAVVSCSWQRLSKDEPATFERSHGVGPSSVSRCEDGPV